MMRIIAITNQKGGVGKTTTATSLAAGLTRKGYKTLLVDVDPQCDSSDTYKAELDDVITLFDVFQGLCANGKEKVNRISEAIQVTELGDIIAGDIQLATSDMLYAHRLDGFELLKNALQPLKSKYDFIVIDTPPALGSLTANALIAANSIIIPVWTERFSLKGIGQLTETISQAKSKNKELTIDGILLTCYDGRTVLARTLQETLADMAHILNTKIFDTKIRRSVVMGESQNQQDSIFNYAPTSTTGIDYDNFIMEYLERVGVKVNV